MRLAWLLALLLLPGCSLGWVGVSFDDDRPAELDVRTVAKADGEGLALVRPKINGREVGWFALDTGASHMVIDRRLARELDLTERGSLPISECAMSASFRHADTLELGRFRARWPVFVALDLGNLSARASAELGEPFELAGLIGAPLFRRVVFEIERPEREFRAAIYDPKSYELPRGAWRKLKLMSGRPVVSARLEGGHTGRFLLDTGKAGTLSLMPPFIQRHDLLADRSVVRRPNHRLCGQVDELEGELGWFELAGNRFDRPTVRFKIPNTLGSDGMAVDGNVGQGFLAAFTTVFDYTHRRIAFLTKGGPR